MKLAYGGVVFDAEGRVLLREPMSHYDDYVWTFAKGRPDTGESAEAAACREVEEETGVVAKVEAPVPGAFLGGTTENRYFVMSAVEDHGRFGGETVAVRWVTPAEARDLIAMTTNGVGKQRDLAVLEAAVKVWTAARGK